MVGLEGEVWPDMVDSANGRVAVMLEIGRAHV